jgi:hypothetical protein
MGAEPDVAPDGAVCVAVTGNHRYAPGYRPDKPLCCELPKYHPVEWQKES